MSMKFAGLNILLVAMCFGLTGCPDTPQDSSDYSWTYPQSTETAGPDWSIDQVSLRCSDPDQCPANQGVLVGYSRTYRGYEIKRCTGTVIGPHTVLTAGHCVEHFKGSDQLWFKTVNTATSPSRTFHAAPGADVFDSSDTYSADYGIFTLSEAASGYQYSAPAKTVPSPLTKVKIIVVNGVTTGSMTDLKLDVVPCDHGSDKLDRVTYDMNPTVFRVTNCKIYSGNSGGSVTLPDNLYAVVGVVSASNNAQSTDAKSLEQILKDMRDPKQPTKVDAAVAANVRCASLQDWPQMIPNCLTISFDKMSKMTNEINAKNATGEVKALIANWLHSPDSKLTFGRATLQALPIPAQITDIGRQAGPVIVPGPLCLTGKLTHEVAQLVNLAAVDSKAIGTQVGGQMLVSIQPVSEGIYHVHYTPLEAQLETPHKISNIKSVDLEALKQGVDLPIPQCQGNEVQNMIDEIDKMSLSSN